MRGYREGKPSLIPKRKGNAWAQRRKTITYTQEERECVGTEQEKHRLYPSKWKSVGTEKEKHHSYPREKGMRGHRARKSSPIPKQMEKRGHRARKTSPIPKQMGMRGHRARKSSLIPKRKGNAWAQRRKNITHTQEERECVGTEKEKHHPYPIRKNRIRKSPISPQNKKNRIKMTPNKKTPISKPHRFIIFVDFLNISLSILKKSLTYDGWVFIIGIQ